jgi:hypothetical protein
MHYGELENAQAQACMAAADAIRTRSEIKAYYVQMLRINMFVSPATETCFFMRW